MSETIRAPHAIPEKAVERLPSAPPIVGETADNDQPPISPLVPDTMHRGDSDEAARATSPEFNERADGATSEPPAPPEGRGDPE